MTEEPLHSLAFVLRNAEDVYALEEDGRAPPQGVAREDWAAFWDVLDRADEQRGALLGEALSAFGELGPGLRFEPVTRLGRLSASWEAWGRVFPARRQTPVGLLGVSLAIDASRLTYLHAWWGYLKARAVRGPQLAEVLRERHPSIRVGAVAHGWLAGTVLLADLDLGTPRTLSACAAALRGVAALVEAEREHLLRL